MADDVIDRVSIEVTATAKSASSAISGVESDLKRLKSALSGIDTSNLKNAQTSLTNIGNAVNNVGKKTVSPKIDTSGMTKAERDVQNSVNKLEQALARLNSYKKAALSGDSSSLTSFNRQVIKAQSEIDVLGKKLEQADDKRTGISIDTDALQTYRDRLVEIQGQLSVISVDVTKINGKKLSPDTNVLKEGLSDVASLAKSASSALLKMSSNAIKSGLSTVKSAISKIASSLTNVSSLTSKLGSTGFMKILKYGFGIRSLYVLFRRLRQAVKDSFTELQKSGADFQTTKSNVEALKNSLTTLKYQFGAAFEPIFNTVAPALQTLINYLVTVMNTISAFIAKLTGKSTYSKAVAATGTIAKNTGSAASSAKELNKQLQGFDELNNLSGDSGSGGGGGSGSGGSSSDVTYVEEDVSNALTTFWDTLAEAITNGEWEKAGSLISEKLTNALNDINWDNVYKGAENFGTGLAQFLNGLITDDLFSALGKTVANSINTALKAALSFSEEFDWPGLGSAIASSINSFVENTDLGLVSTTFNSWANGILNALGSAVSGVDWAQIRDKVCAGINGIDTTGIGDKFGTLVNNIANAVYTLVSDKKSWKNLGTKIGDGINSFLDSMSQDNGSGMNGWTATTAGLSSLASGIISSLATTIKTVSWKDVSKGIGDMINGIKAEELGLSLGDLVSGIVNALYTLVSDKDKWELLGTKIGEGINGVLTSMGSVDAQTGLTGWQALGETISGAFSGISTAFEKALETVNWDDVKGAIKGFLGSIDLDSIAVVISDLAVSFMLVEAAQVALKALLEKEAMSVITKSLGPTGTVSVGEVAVAVTLAFVIGWQIGGKLYESATGYEGASQGFIATVQDAWDGLFGENKIEFNLKDFINFTIDDVESGDGWLKTTGLWQSLVKLKTSIENAYNSIFSGSGEESGVAHGYNGAPSEAVPYIESQKVSAYWSDLGKNIVEGIKAGFEAKSQVEYWGSPMLLLLNAIINAFSNEFESNSPAKKMYPLGENIFDGIIEGFKEAMSNFSFSELMEELYDYFTSDDNTTNGNYTGDVKTGQSPKFTLTDEQKTKMRLTVSTEVDTSGIDEALKSGGTMDKYKEKWGKTQATAKFDTDPDTSKAASYTGKGNTLDKLGENWRTWGRNADFGTNPSTKKAADFTGNGGILDTLGKNWRSWGRNADFGTNPDTRKAAGFTGYGNTLDTLGKNWRSWGTNADFGTNPDTRKAAGFTGYGNTLDTLGKNWRSWGTNAYFGTTPDTSSAAKECSANGALGQLSQNWANWGNTATFGASVDYNSFDTAKSELESYKGEWAKNGSTATFNVDFSYDEQSMNDFSKNLRQKLKAQLEMNMKVSVDSGTGTAKLTVQALGGSYYGGSWHDIPQYAKGGKPNYGSMFIAGEAGPEIVGHLNGRTEVLNKSQIAATIHSAFVSSMAQFGNRMLATPESVAIQSGSYSAYNASANGDGQTAMLAEQNRLLAEQNQLLREIAEKDVSISSRDVFNAVKSESNRYNNRTGGSPFLF